MVPPHYSQPAPKNTFLKKLTNYQQMYNTSPIHNFLTGCSCVCDLNVLFAKQSYAHSSNNPIITISFPLSWVGVHSFLPSNARVTKFYSRTSVPKC